MHKEYHRANSRFNFFLTIQSNTMAEISILIENKYFGGEHIIIALKQQLLGMILCFFVHLKWPWLLRFFA